MSEPEKGLLLVAVRVDHPPQEMRRRIQTILAAMATYEQPPDTEACVFAKPVDELVAADLDCLAHFMGWDAVRRLNVGDVASPRPPCPTGECGLTFCDTCRPT